MCELLEVIKWYEERFGRKLTEAEKLSVRGQVALNNADMKKIVDSKKLEIRLGGLKYEQNNCHLVSCRYNRNGICQNEDKRKECIDVSKLVLCLEDRKDE